MEKQFVNYNDGDIIDLSTVYNLEIHQKYNNTEDNYFVGMNLIYRFKNPVTIGNDDLTEEESVKRLDSDINTLNELGGNFFKISNKNAINLDMVFNIEIEWYNPKKDILFDKESDYTKKLQDSTLKKEELNNALKSLNNLLEKSSIFLSLLEMFTKDYRNLNRKVKALTKEDDLLDEECDSLKHEISKLKREIDRENEDDFDIDLYGINAYFYISHYEKVTGRRIYTGTKEECINIVKHIYEKLDAN